MKTQKRNWFALMGVMALVCVGCSGASEPHIGEWINMKPKPGDIYSLTLEKNNEAIMEVGDQVMGGNHYIEMEPGVELSMIFTYEIDYDKDPVWIDFTMYPNDVIFKVGSERYGEEQQNTIREIIRSAKDNPDRSKGIVRFISKTQMEMQISPEGQFQMDRPVDFDENDENYMMFEKR